MTEALITPSILAWARHRRGLDSTELAPSLNVKPEAIDAWEAGDRRPTFRQAHRLAQALHVPFGYLFLSEPPIEELPIPDFRTFAGETPRQPSPDFLDLLNDVLTKQQWFREYRLSEGVEELPFVGRFRPTDPEEVVAGDIREVIDIGGARDRATNWENFLRELSLNAERSGIMVMRSGVVGNNGHRPLDVEEFRGFTITDEVAPLIFINGQDFKGAQTFTLAHEMAHLWAGLPGVSNPDYGLNSQQRETSVEKFCNRVAAEALVPGEDFRKRWQTDGARLEDNLRPLVRHYKVSAMVILRQAHDYDFIPTNLYWEGYRQLLERGKSAEGSRESGGNFHHTLTARNGVEFTQAVISCASEGTLLSRDAADMLGVKVKTLPAIADHLFGSSLNLG